ncbi:MAG: DSD1 family PLP-dependent enzyme [Trueperaceae bacterium]|nr:MAG: DSD1 family PLP-dependent enzyme [Trueperaceae bacterium]
MSEVGLHKTELDTPALWVELDTMEANIATLASHFRAAGVAWRPHTKGLKVPAIAHKALRAGAIGVTCAKLGEAEVMAAAGISDILIANQIVTPKKIARLVALRHHADVKVAVDNSENVTALGAAASAAGRELGVLVHIDSGMHRTGVQPGEPVLELAVTVAATPGLELLGVMSWEGHILAHGDPDEKRQAAEEAMDLVSKSVELCRAHGLACPVVSCGGSGTAEVTPHTGAITEIQAGGGIFCDSLYRSWNRLTEPSLFVRTTVSSRPAPKRVILDAGFKSMPMWFGQPQPLDFPLWESMAFSAEHGVITLVEPDESIRVGDAHDFVIGYGDATVFLHDLLYGVRDETVEVVWPILGRGKLR